MEANIIVYVVNISKMFEAGGENVGKSYSLEEFELEFNSERIDPEKEVIRFVKKPNKKKTA